MLHLQNRFPFFWRRFSDAGLVRLLLALRILPVTWMSQEASKWLVNGLFHLLVNGIYWGEMIDPNGA